MCIKNIQVARRAWAREGIFFHSRPLPDDAYDACDAVSKALYFFTHTENQKTYT